MSAQNGHITSKVILGYLLLILIAVCSVVYIYNIIEQFAGEDDPNNKSREKVYLVTNTLSLLYESEADRKSTRLNSSHRSLSRMPSSA